MNMELWREQLILEQTNLTRNGEWLELVKRKAERQEAAKAKGSDAAKPKPLTARQKRIAEHKADQVEKKLRRASRAERNKLRAEWRKTLPPEQAEAKIKQLKVETKAARKNRAAVRKRKPNPFERDAFYMGAKDFACSHPDQNPYDAVIQYLSAVGWLHPQSVEGIAAAVSQRLGAMPLRCGN